jgi:putative colanic acid biosynthesis UDP-glucose lipid carrier transferase
MKDMYIDVGKPCLDRFLAFFGLTMLMPLLLLIAFLVKATSKGPVLYRQTRFGFKGKAFLILKFRTMYKSSSFETTQQASRNDHRITKVGNFLRRTSLDELPQLINVLKGEMSLVGPRPHAKDHNEYYEEVMPRYAVRYAVRPGLTGLAQVRGQRGETDTIKKMAARVSSDIEYIKKMSLVTDLRILWKTIWVVLRQENAY